MHGNDTPLYKRLKLVKTSWLCYFNIKNNIKSREKEDLVNNYKYILQCLYS